MQPLIRHLLQPAPDFGIGGSHIQLQPGRFQARSQRDVEGSAQIAVEALNLALGLGAVRTVQLDGETAVACIIEKSRVEAMLLDMTPLIRASEGLEPS